MLRWLTILAAGITMSGSVFAHEGIGPHGGRLADTSKHHLELALKADSVDVFVSDRAGAPIRTIGLSGIVIVVVGGVTTRVVLSDGGDRLSGKATTDLSGASKSVVQIKMLDGQTLQASFD